MIYADSEVSGIEHFQDHLFELITDVRYELFGPEAIYDRSDWKDMDEEERQYELDNWDEPTEERERELSVKLDTLHDVWDLANKAARTLYDRAAKDRHEYNQRESRRPEYYYRAFPYAYMSTKEEMWRKSHNRY